MCDVKRFKTSRSLSFPRPHLPAGLSKKSLPTMPGPGIVVHTLR